MIGPFFSPSYLLPPITVFLSCLVLILLVWRAAPPRTSTLLFLGVLLSLGLWSSLLFGMRISPNVEQAYLWEKAMPALFHAAFVFYYHFTLEITNTKGHKVIIFIAYLSLLIVAALTPTNLILDSMRIESYGYAPVLGPLGLVVGFIDILLMIGGGFNLFKRYRISSLYEEKNRILYLIIALAFPLCGAFLDGFTNLPPLAVWGNLVFCVLCTVAIIKYHLLDIRLIIRKSLAYLLVSIIAATPYISLLYLLRFIDYPLSEIWWVHFLLLLIIAIIIRPLYSWAQHSVDKLFYRDRYDHLKALERFIHEFHSVTHLEKLVSNMVRLTRDALKASSVCLLLPSETRVGFTTVSYVGSDHRFSTIGINDNLFLKWLETQEHVVSSDDLDTFTEFKGSTPRRKIALENISVKLCVPIKNREGKLSGVLLLGEKLGHQIFTNEDKELLYTLGNQMGMALENAYLYDLEKSIRKELEKQVELRTEFLHQVAHELKTPLTSIISSSEILYEQPVILDDFRERLIENIKNSADVMDRRVSELLDVARVQTDNFILKKETIDINGLLSNIALQLQSIFKAKEQTLKLEIADSLPKINADRSKLEEILYNLLTNANKFSPISSNVVLRAKDNNGQVILEVEDSAPAISKQDKERIFEPYYRSGDSNKRQRFPGLGLGLFIVKNLIELHQGRIWVKSRATKGNKFVFSLPTLGREPRESGDY